MSDLPDLRPEDLRANRMDLIGRLANDLAHEIKNPLNSMVVNLELVRRLSSTGRADAAVERVGIVEEAVQLVHTLVNALLKAMGRPAEETDADTALVLLDLQPLLEARAHLARVQLSFEGDEGGRVAMPARELAQILLNLVDNAMNAVGKGGRIRVFTVAGPDTVTLQVEDSGPGFPGGVREQAAAEGGGPRERAGLGLAVCSLLVDRRGGRLDLEASDELGGASARVTIPRAGGGA